MTPATAEATIVDAVQSSQPPVIPATADATIVDAVQANQGASSSSTRVVSSLDAIGSSPQIRENLGRTLVRHADENGEVRLRDESGRQVVLTVEPWSGGNSSILLF